jgi:hypothetical protein
MIQVGGGMIAAILATLITVLATLVTVISTQA